MSSQATRSDFCLDKNRSASTTDHNFKVGAKDKKEATRRADRFCKVCNIVSKYSEKFYSHINSIRHINALQNNMTNLFRNLCKNMFMCYQDLAPHRTGAGYFKEIHKAS